MSKLTSIQAPIAATTLAVAKLIEAARQLLVIDGLLLDTPVIETTVKIEHTNLAVSATTKNDIIIINIPLTKGVPNTTKIAVHSEMNGELIVMRAIRKKMIRATKQYTALLTYAEKVFKEVEQEVTKHNEKSKLRNEIQVLNSVLNDNTNDAAVSVIKDAISNLNERLKQLSIK